ncbi:MAG: leucyl aminopeptidase [bacterium]|nr:leucyl aminopeptidase [bacterium]
MKHQAITSLEETTILTYILTIFKGESVDEKGSLFTALSAESGEYIKKVVSSFDGTLGKVEKVTLPAQEEKIVLLLGLGEREKYTARKYNVAIRALIKGMRSLHITSAVIDSALPLPIEVERHEGMRSFAINAEMANYEFVKYKETPQEGWFFVEELSYLVDASQKEKILNEIEQGAIIGVYTSHARDLSNTPGGDMTPSILAEEAKKLAQDSGATCDIIGEEEMAKLGMGGILGVSKGSVEDARLIVLEYHGADEKEKPLVFLGKGITFDSGGLDLKISGSMLEMHMDMTGAGSVISAVCAIAKLGLKVNIVGVCPAVENMPSGQSYRPGDLLKSMSGKTIEVLTPDAEGRIVLADALTYTEKRYDPALVVDLATLTGACVVALGTTASAVLTPDDAFAQEICAIGERAGDYMWPLPLWEEYESEVKGTFGDVINAGSQKRSAGTINAGMFLYQFAKSFKKWAHIDIASTMTTSDGQFLSKGASGTGVRFLVELARSRAL